MIRRRPQLVFIAERRISLDGCAVAYVVKRSSQAKHVRFEIRDGTGLAVIIPRHCSLNTLDDMVRSKSRWILRNIERFDQAARSPSQGLRFGDTTPYLGQELRVLNCPEPGSSHRVERQGQALLVRQDVVDQTGLNPVVAQWYRQQAATVLKQRADEWATKLGVTYNRFTVRSQTTRWASCSHKGTLSFNWRLMMAPDPVVDYVVLHETAHLREMNHTKRFWSLVAEHCPSWRKHKKWLSDNGPEISARLNSAR